MYFDSFKEISNLTINPDIVGVHGPNRRKLPRTPCLISAIYNIKSRFYSSFILDLSDVGAFIETDREHDPGETIVLQYIDPSYRRSLLVNGKIAWSRDNAIGVNFNYIL